MRGQWLGTYSGDTTGLIIINIDELPTCFQGVAYLNEENKQIPSAAVFFRTADKSAQFQFRTSSIIPINPLSGYTDAWDNIKHMYSDDAFVSQYADIQGNLADNILSLSWKSEQGVSGHCSLPRSKADQPSTVKSKKKGWASFKSYVSGLEGRRYLFRGQNNPWRLRTSYHRTGRADLARFVNDDIQALHRHLSARTKHVFNLGNPDENGAFYNLVQHHGYPTPLLDWSYSPYVAAFFAYRGISKEQASLASPKEKVRIYLFDQALWKSDYNQILTILHSQPHFSVSEFLAIENERMIPQQAASSVTNVDDVESYIQYCESRMGKSYLHAIDLPINERDQVFQELRYMGITAGSMFPGLDGACEELKERNFDA